MTFAGAELDPYWFPCDGPLWGVPHGANVLTNLPFLVVGLWGLVRLRRAGPWRADDRNRIGLWVSVALLALGSGAYHVWLTPATLAADRACICGIMAFSVAEVLAVVRPGARRAAVTWGLFAVAQASVLAWCLGATSLFYGALQVLGSLVTLGLAIGSWRKGALPGGDLRALVSFIGLYALAKLAELFDQAVCDATGVIGGHPLKHLLAAAALAALLPWLGRPSERGPSPT
jgi:hypothetical protein